MPNDGYDLLKAELSYTHMFRHTFSGSCEITMDLAGDATLNERIRNHISFKKAKMVRLGLDATAPRQCEFLTTNQSGIVPFFADFRAAEGDKNTAVHYSENENCLPAEEQALRCFHRGFCVSWIFIAGFRARRRGLNCWIIPARYKQAITYHPALNRCRLRMRFEGAEST